MLVPEGNPPCGPEKKVSFAIPCGSQILLSHWFAVVQIGPTPVFEGHIHRYLEIIFCDINARTALCILQFISWFFGRGSPSPVACNKEEELSLCTEFGLWVTRKMAGGGKTLATAGICGCKDLFCVLWRGLWVCLFHARGGEKNTEIITADIHAPPPSHFSMK